MSTKLNFFTAVDGKVIIDRQVIRPGLMVVTKRNILDDARFEEFAYYRIVEPKKPAISKYVQCTTWCDMIRPEVAGEYGNVFFTRAFLIGKNIRAFVGIANWVNGKTLPIALDVNEGKFISWPIGEDGFINEAEMQKQLELSEAPQRTISPSVYARAISEVDLADMVAVLWYPSENSLKRSIEAPSIHNDYLRELLAKNEKVINGPSREFKRPE